MKLLLSTLCLLCAVMTTAQVKKDTTPVLSSTYKGTPSHWMGFITAPGIQYQTVNDSIANLQIQGDPAAAIKNLLEYTNDLNAQLAECRLILATINLDELSKGNKWFAPLVTRYKLTETLWHKKYDFGNWKPRYK